MTYRDPTPLDPNKDYTAVELAQFIREKMTGKATREAMALSLLKANEVAQWSSEVAQQIIDESFDLGELNTEIERKLNELEQQYAPELTNVKTQLAETVEDVIALNINKVGQSEIDKIDSRIDNIIASTGDGTKDTEIIDARTDDRGRAHSTLKKRLDNDEEIRQLVTNSIDNTRVEYKLNIQGQVIRAIHRDVVSNSIIREDAYNYDGNIITETRTLDSGSLLVITSDLTKMESTNELILNERIEDKLIYNLETWIPWNIHQDVSVEDGFLKFEPTGSSTLHTYYASDFKDHTRYGLLLHIGSHTTATPLRITPNITDGVQEFVSGYLEIGKIKKSFMTGVVTDHRFGLTAPTSVTSGEFSMKDLRLFELTPGSVIERDFSKLSAEELNNKYPKEGVNIDA